MFSNSTQPNHKRGSHRKHIWSQHHLNKYREALHILRKYVANENADIAQLVNDKLLNHFKEICIERQKYPEIQLDVLWILLNISFQHKYINQIFDNAFIRIYLQFLKAPSYAIKHHALWILGIAAGESVELRDTIMLSALDDILSIIASEFDKTHCTNYGELPQEYDKLMAISTFILYRFCDKGMHSNQNKHKLLQTIECLLCKYGEEYKVTFNISVLDDDIIEIRSQIVWCLCALAMHHNDDREFLDLLCNETIIKALLYFVSSNNDHIVDGSLRTIGCILKHSNIWDKYVSICMKYGLCKAIKGCMTKYMELDSLNDAQSIIMQHICWLISKVSEDSFKSVKALKTNRLFVDCIELMLNNEDINIGKQALIAVTNAILQSNEDMIEYLVNNGCIDAMFGLDIDDGCIRCILDSLECVCIHKKYAQKVENLGGLRFLHKIKEGAVDGIFSLNEWKATNLIGKCFEVNTQNDHWFAFDMKHITTQ